MFKRAFKYRFYPTAEQQQLLAQTFGCVRFVYNSILRWRTDAYYESKAKIGYIEANAKLSEMKQSGELPWLSEVSSVPLQQCLRHQQKAFSNFFAGRARYPTFKKKRSRQSAEFTRSAFKYKDGGIYTAKSKTPLDIRWSRDLPSEPSTITITKDSADRYFVSCLCEVEPTKAPATSKVVGIDLGLNDLFITSEGSKTGNPRNARKYAAKLAKYQRRLAKKELGSANRAKAKRKVARVHAKISDSRMDNLHKLSRKLINENQVICVESLSVKNMLKNPKLAKSISDASWGEFVRQLEYKGLESGRSIVTIDRFFPSSKRCSSCGHIADSMPLSVRSWTCPECGYGHDRDINAAMNIKAAGLAVLAFGENVSDDSISMLSSSSW
ncbi:MAG: RNA-guided endonuclease TnpB family protein [Candidatus Thiodiazotropha endolucinida]